MSHGMRESSCRDLMAAKERMKSGNVVDPMSPSTCRVVTLSGGSSSSSISLDSSLQATSS